MMKYPITPLYEQVPCDGMRGLRAVLYCRVAHNDGSALELQVDELRCYAEQAGFTVVDTAAEYAGGHTLDRTGLKKATQAIRDNKAELVLVKDLSRISRNLIQFQDFIDTLTAYDATLYCMREQILFKGRYQHEK